jgi:glycosyltransferase involved in cell wall biosynthesis
MSTSMTITPSLSSSSIRQDSQDVSGQKVLFVLGTLWGENGITSHLLTLSKGLQRSGWQVAIASGLASNSDAAIEEAYRAVERFASLGIPHFVVNFASLKPTPANLKNGLQTVQGLSRVLATFKPDVIHLHSLSIAPYVKLAAMRYRVPIISTSHLEPETQNPPTLVRAQLNRLISSLWGDRLIAISREIQQFFEDSLRVNAQRVKLVYHGIDATHFRPPSPEEKQLARLDYGLMPSDRAICLVGRLDPVKGHDVLIKALSLLKKQNFEVIALVAGKSYGDELDRVMQQAHDHDVTELVHCVGMVETRNVLWASEMIVLPSRREGFPLVILEGMLCGVIPIRTPAAGAFDQIQDGVDGWIVPFDSPEILASRIRGTFENVDLKNLLSTKALQSSQDKFTLDRMIHQTIVIYDEVLIK